MFADPIFLLSLAALFFLLGLWIYQVLQDTLTDQNQQLIYISGLSASLIGIYRIFINAGDLGSVLLIGSVICLVIYFIGLISRNGLLKTTGRGWFIPVFLIFVLRTFAYEPYQIPSGSMIPGLKVGDFILVNKYSYGLRLPVFGTKIVDIGQPKIGDVMVFIPPHENEYFIKRVIGIPGDKIRYQNKTLFINDQKQTLDFISQYPPINPEYLVYNESLGETEHGIHRNPYVDPRILEWQVPPGNYFMMGDNRDQSSDSRYWGFVPEKNIVGKAIAVWLHKEPGLKFPEIDKNRWIE